MSNNTIILTKEQLEAFNNGESTTLQRKFIYPVYFKNKEFGFVVKFTNLTTGEVVEEANGGQAIGYISTGWIEHTNTNIWEYLPDYKEIAKWRPKGGNWYVDPLGEIEEAYSDYKSREFGVERETREEAEYAARQMSIHNRLLAYVAEFDKDWKADWTYSASQDKYFVYYNYGINEYDINEYCTGCHVTVCLIGIVYMSKECATELCRKLNSGEVVL